MLIMRFFVLLTVLAIGGSMVLWLLTGQPQWRLRAWKAFRVALVVIFLYLALFVLERLLVPLA